ncbi:RCC1 domain-containing protein [Legionella jamestowniensis]|uniref:Regulator of chromosome condensation (RCC1) repeat protein n=1 Tax=Legionella jamestowniensis TaxID=455 RepID=A0A0W0UIG8_9GAMM|nr:hypothetical protein [Legionella jamestowniensis]KTD07691.1 Regulator of chromosome condensation (RCC1) repeat protein [Legionella jamestowniensis]SFL60717.1 Regulator of chromosome condensation (RCC1) repeat-containing protein [Legionella jamestowniensis DSM 19215]
MTSSLVDTDDFIFHKLPIDLIFYLASNYLDYSNAINFFEVLILKSFKLQDSIKLISNYATTYHSDRRFTLYRQQLPAQIVAGTHTSFYFSPMKGWYVWGSNPFPCNVDNALISKPQPLRFPPQNAFSMRQIRMIANRNCRTFFLTTVGIYMTDPQTPLQPLNFTSALMKDEKIVQIALGANHALALSNKGKVYSWGDNTLGQLGLGDLIKSCDAFTLIPTLEDKIITNVFTGDCQSFCLTAEKEVYAFGANMEGQLGLNSDITKHFIPRRIRIDILSTIKVKGIASSSDHTLFLTEEGQVYSCGSNYGAKLGISTGAFREVKSYKPILIKKLQNLVIDKIAAGKNHSLCVTATGQLYGFGSNVCDQLSSENIKFIRAPLPLNSFADKIITEISVGRNHALCLDKEGNLYSFGDSTGGVLGRDACAESKEVILKSTSLAENPKAKIL